MSAFDKTLKHNFTENKQKIALLLNGEHFHADSWKTLKNYHHLQLVLAREKLFQYQTAHWL